MSRTMSAISSRRWVTDGGLETDLIFHHDADLPEFAAFPLLDSDEGRGLLRDYYLEYVEVARKVAADDPDAGLILDTPTWRANPDWAAQIGYDPEALRKSQIAAVELVQQVRDQEAADLPRVLVNGAIGPRGDGYLAPDDKVDPAEAAAYHLPQIQAMADAGADLVTAYTLTGTGEAIGIVRAAREVGVPVGISFTLETDGRLPDGTALAEAIAEVDTSAPPDHYLLNCAHPTHVAPALEGAGEWRERIVGTRVNASTRTHAELDEATELDEGDLDLLVSTQDALRPMLPNLAIVGGCCGTDARHIAALWGVG